MFTQKLCVPVEPADDSDVDSNYSVHSSDSDADSNYAVPSSDYDDGCNTSDEEESDGECEMLESPLKSDMQIIFTLILSISLPTFPRQIFN